MDINRINGKPIDIGKPNPIERGTIARLRQAMDINPNIRTSLAPSDSRIRRVVGGAWIPHPEYNTGGKFSHHNHLHFGFFP